ncbi:MAG: transketolase [Melioribacteraceae bacterium]|nr:transketolase [Melioribacteraceae bacterium]
MSKNIQQLSIDTIRLLAVDGVQKANSGHPGMPMGCAPIAYLLYAKLMKHNPGNPKWINRDRFILSAGHGSMLLYSVLHLTGYKVSMEDLQSFRQWESITPGHPEYGLTEGVETTTGPLGQGFTNAVGMALAQKFMASKFNKNDKNIIDHYIYGICSDGDLMEGVSHEAASFAGHNKLGSLIFFYDNNKITIDGSLALSMSEDVGKRFEAYGWHVQYVDDVNDLVQLEKAAINAQNEKDRPSLIVTNTVIGYGSPNKKGTAGSHGSPLGEEEVKLTKQFFGFPEDKTFYIPDEVQKHFNELKNTLPLYEEEWKKLYAGYRSNYPEDTKLLDEVMNGNFGNDWLNSLPVFENYGEGVPTRSASGNVLTAIAEKLPTLLGGSADLTPSNNTQVKSYVNFSPDDYSGRYVRYGIREHAMASMMNGICMYGGIIPYGGTFLVFSDYLRPAIRLAALSHIRPIYVFTHDSIGLGEDGPTHQPVEHFAALRAIPGLVVIRPADANETAQAWKVAITHHGGPVAILLTRQKIPVIDRTVYSGAENLEKGAYILKDCEGKPDIILMGSGSEVYLLLQASEKLEADSIKTRVVSFPSWELFESQSDDYRESVLPADVTARLSVEAGVKLGWERYTGLKGDSISIDKYGASAPFKILFDKYGFGVDNIVARAKKLVK